MNKKILLICDTHPDHPWQRDRLPAIKIALENFDHAIIDIFEFEDSEKAHEIHNTKGRYFFSNKDLKLLNKKIIKKILAHKPNIVIFATVDNYCQYLIPETIDCLHDNNIFTVGILGDDEFTYKINRYYVRLFDKVVVYVKNIIDEYDKLKKSSCYYLPNSCLIRERDFDDFNLSKEKYDLLLFGAPFGMRPKIMKELANKNLNIAIYGSKKWLDYPELKKYYHGYAPSDKFDEIISRAKIILAPLEDYHTGALHMNTKIWEAARNGKMCICTYYQPLIDDYGFENEKEIIMYRSIDEIIKNVEYYIKNNDKRIQIARNLFNKVKNEFSYDNLYKKLFTDIINDSQANVSSEEKTIRITILNLFKNNKQGDSFNYTEYSNKHSLYKTIEEAKTQFIILSYEKTYYSPFLNEIVDIAFSNNGLGMLAINDTFNPFNNLNKLICKIDNIVWEKNFLLKKIAKNGKIKKTFFFPKISDADCKIFLCETKRSSFIKVIAKIFTLIKIMKYKYDKL